MHNPELWIIQKMRSLKRLFQSSEVKERKRRKQAKQSREDLNEGKIYPLENTSSLAEEGGSDIAARESIIR